ncbi:hypothetical protein NDN08_002139 [Rhodosorus marinus]|uniref:C2H2-type domain-containing protein n=1 Tax=Rhodosorus marinus TaxID=101924 RepID=A0AAV8UX04_9RHOD|nr:hypothetical protein NDN08_002139 [Rhodosorus marinus]
MLWRDFMVGRSWICDICFRSYATKWNLKNHKRKHKDERTYVCSCGERFLWKPQLDTHQRSVVCQDIDEVIEELFLGTSVSEDNILVEGQRDISDREAKEGGSSETSKRCIKKRRKKWTRRALSEQEDSSDD